MTSLSELGFSSRALKVEPGFAELRRLLPSSFLAGFREVSFNEASDIISSKSEASDSEAASSSSNDLGPEKNVHVIHSYTKHALTQTFNEA